MANAVSYAEDTLGVHSVYKEARDVLAEHDHITSSLVDARLQAKVAQERLDDREAELQVLLKAEYSQLNSTDYARVFKQRFRQDPAAMKIRETLVDNEISKSHLEDERRHMERHLAILEARLVELGGLLTFYAASKNQTIKQGATA